MAKNSNNDEHDPYNFFGGGSGDDNNNDKNDKKPGKFPFFPILLAVIAVFAFVHLFMGSDKGQPLIDFSEFKQKISSKEIVKVEISENIFTGYGEETPEPVVPPANPGERTKAPNSFSRTGFLSLNQFKPKFPEYKSIGVVSEGFLDFLDQTVESSKDEAGQQHFTYRFVPKERSYFLDILLQWILPFGLIFIMYFFLIRRMGGGAGSVFAGGSKSKAVDEGKVKTRFSDVAGVDEAKDDLVEVVDFLKSPKKYTDIGGKIPKGVLLVGPPGTGKTLLARAVAGEAGVPFFRISGSDFVEMFVGVGASRVRDLFKQAREKAPCIVFIDEIDALGKSRSSGYGAGNDEREQTLNQLLVEMDGFDNEKGLIILAATNRADILDAALLRPGRFDRQVPVEKPDVKGREEILRIHAKNVKLDSDVDFNSVAHGTTGFAGADLANVVNEAALLAVRNGRKKVTMVDFNEAIDKVSIGLKKKSRKDNEKEHRLVAVHESGHALVAAFTPDHEPVNKITVVPRSHGIGGFTQYREEKEKNFMTQKDLINEIDSMLGGRAAEQVILGDVSTGASNDIARATEIIKSMIVDYGMSSKFKNMTLGKGVLGNRGGEPNLVREFSEETQKYVDEEIARIMGERYEYVVDLLTKKKDLLDYVANRLIKIETMDGKEFADIIKSYESPGRVADDSDRAEESAETADSDAEIAEVKADEAEKTEAESNADSEAEVTDSAAEDVEEK